MPIKKPYKIYPMVEKDNLMTWSPFEHGSSEAETLEEAEGMANDYLTNNPDLTVCEIQYKKFKTKQPVRVKLVRRS